MKNTLRSSQEVLFGSVLLFFFSCILNRSVSASDFELRRLEAFENATVVPDILRQSQKRSLQLLFNSSVVYAVGNVLDLDNFRESTLPSKVYQANPDAQKIEIGKSLKNDSDLVKCWNDSGTYNIIFSQNSSSTEDSGKRKGYISVCKLIDENHEKMLFYKNQLPTAYKNNANEKNARKKSEDTAGKKIYSDIGFCQIKAIAKTSEILFEAIVYEESNGDPSAINPHTGALGIGQIMPQNLDCSWNNAPQENCGWDFEMTGRDVSAQEFLDDAEIQKNIVGGKLQLFLLEQIMEGHQLDIAIRRVAAEWYSGNPNLYTNAKPQNWGYESIYSYSENAFKTFQSIKEARDL